MITLSRRKSGVLGALFPVVRPCHTLPLSPGRHPAKTTPPSLQQLNIYDTERTYQSKSTFELCRSLSILKLCTYSTFVKNSETLMKVSRRALGQTLFDKLMKKTIYGQFAGGVNIEEMTPVIHHLGKYGVDSMLNYSVETDLEEEEGEEETKNEQSLAALIAVLEASTNVCSGRPLCSFKLTGLTTTQVLYQFTEVLDAIETVFLNNSTPFTNRQEFVLQLAEELRDNEALLVNRRMYKRDFLKLMSKYGENVATRLFEEFDEGATGYLEYYQFRELILRTTQQISIDEIPKISTELQQGLDRLNGRLERLALMAIELNTQFMIDAEQTYFQSAIDHVVRKIMRKHNKNKVYIFNTYQCCRTQTPNNLILDAVDAISSDYQLGVKLVRGAYVEQERARAELLGYPSPINATKELTDTTYHNMLDVLFELVHADTCTMIAASHNEVTVQYVRQKIQDYGIDPQSGKVYFGQLYGLCDPITFTLSNSGYVAVKAIAYGPVEAVLPFLARRAQENNGVLEGTAREMKLLRMELRRRVVGATS